MNKLLLAVVLLLFASCGNKMRSEASDPLYRVGDDKQWAEKDYADTGWSTTKGPTKNQVFWVRVHVKLNDSTVQAKPLGLQLFGFGAFEVYLDGVLIGRNGQLGQAGKPEVPGTEMTCFPIPDSLASKGEHVVALRATQTYQQAAQRGVKVVFQNYSELLRGSLIILAFMNLIAGGLLIAAIYYFFLYISSRRKEHAILIFGIICLLFFALLILEYVKFYVDIPYNFFYTRLEVIGWLTFLLAILVPLYFSLQFGFKRKLWLLGLLCCSLIAIYVVHLGHYDITAVYYSYTMWIATVLVVLDAVIRKEKGALVVLFGLLTRVIINYFLYYDFSLFISFAILVLCMLYLHAIRARVIEEEHEASLLLSARLRLDLVKKNIQPHFLKNTLTSLIDWIEESPKQGVEFLHSLSKEFDIMNTISDEALIPIRKEIELCKAHLSVMQFRKEIHYEWEENGIDETELIPPAFLHTLLENGITHSMPPADGHIRFKLQFVRSANSKTYTFETIAMNRPKSKNRIGGNGFSYIEARLRESYGNHWEFISVATDTGWLSTIKLKQVS